MRRIEYAGEANRRYMAKWHGSPYTSTRAAETRALGDWPPFRPSGPEPGSHDLGFFGVMSNNEKRLLTIGALGLGAFLYFKRKKKR